MPIHPPRARGTSNRPKRDRTDDKSVDFNKMLLNWAANGMPHLFDLHFPDYSCCCPSLRAKKEDIAEFTRALMKLDIATVERLRQQFEGAYLDLKYEKKGDKGSERKAI